MKLCIAIKSFFHKLELYLLQRTKESESQIIPFASLALVIYLAYFIGSTLNTNGGMPFFHPEIGLICLGLLSKDYWPNIAKQHFFPFYWYFSIFYLLPVYLSWMFFNHFDSVAWTMVELFMVVVLALLLDWVLYSLLLVTGFLLSYGLYALSGQSPIESLFNNDYFYLIAMSAVVSVILLRSRDLSLRARFKAMTMVSSVMAHELRTPLLTLRAGITAMRKYSPILINAYEKAQEMNAGVEPIRIDRLETLSKSMTEMVVSLNYSNMVVDALLAGFDNSSQTSADFAAINASQAIMSAIEQYSFTDEEINRVELLESPNFNIIANEAVLVHIFHNLFKYAFSVINESKSGIVKVWTDKKGSKGYIYFMHTASGLSKHKIKHIFDLVFSNDEQAAKMSTCLYLSKAAVERMDGCIVCESKTNATTFIMSFPLASN